MLSVELIKTYTRARENIGVPMEFSKRFLKMVSRFCAMVFLLTGDPAV